MRKGFHPVKNAEETTVMYVNYYLVPGVWVDNSTDKPQVCWGTFTPDKKLIGCSYKFLDAKEKVKNHKISKFFKMK